jgi:hypothetical protein
LNLILLPRRLCRVLLVRILSFFLDDLPFLS